MKIASTEAKKKKKELPTVTVERLKSYRCGGFLNYIFNKANRHVIRIGIMPRTILLKLYKIFNILPCLRKKKR